MQRTRVQSLVREDATCYGPLSPGAKTTEAGLLCKIFIFSPTTWEIQLFSFFQMRHLRIRELAKNTLEGSSEDHPVH